jgi:Secretion system C-terminal sorting domain
MLANANNINIPSVVGSDSLALWTCCFSPNKRFLYTTDGYKMWQLDLQSSNILNSRIKVGNWDGTKVFGVETSFFQMKLAFDNKIYNTIYGSSPYIHVINFPDLLGASCGFVQKQIYLGSPYYGHFQDGAIPNTPNYALGAINCGVGVENIRSENDEINVYPNPTNSNITITNTSIIQTIAIYDVLGQEIYHKNSKNLSETINVTRLSNGLYFLKIQDEKGNVTTKKFVKE